MKSRLAKQRVRFAAGATAVVLVAGCGASSTPGTSASGKSDAKTTGGQVVAFIPTSTQDYVAAWVRGAQMEAAKDGVKLRLIENNFDQNAEDSQVQQYLAAGQKAAAFIWWPADALAGLASLALLHATGSPVVQTNQHVVAGSQEYLTAYAGVNDQENGAVTGQNVVAARNAMKAAGVKLHSPGGNLIIIGLSTGYEAGVIRDAEVTKVAQAAGMKVIGSINAGFDAAAGYQYGSQLITRTKPQGIDVVVSLIDDLTAGVMRALKEQGFTPGKNVYVVAGTCSAGLPYIQNGEEYATGIQPGESEGALAVSTAVNASKGGIPHFTDNYMPNQSITKKNIDTYTLDGKSVAQLCNE
jgi:ribose transport system substrate-binding protein